jgi:hypothetical protein
MGTKRLKRPRDPLALAKIIGDIATGRALEAKPEVSESEATKWGRVGGIKGGRNRAEKLSAEKRREIARHAARSRWNKSD